VNVSVAKDNHQAVVWDPIEAVGTLDDWVHQREDIYWAPLGEIEEMKVAAARAAVEHHLTHNQDYRRYSDRVGFDPSRLQTARDLATIPLLTSSQFKLRRVLTGTEEQVVKICTSSGTQGSISRVHRDETTLCRFLSSVRGCLEQMLGLDDAFCVHLGPSKEEAKDLWIAYAMSVTDMLFPTENFVVDEVFHPERVISRIHEVRDEFEHVMMIGAPIMYLHLAKHLAESGETLDGCGNFVMITAGGWKRFSGSSISRPEMVTRLQRSFRGLEPANVRDFFNMVEFNTVLAECEFGVMHGPPWVHLLTLDPETLQPVMQGEEGVFGFIDPTATSYPAFIFSDDLARISLDGECRCGRRGQAIEFIRRINRVESRGCALKMDRTHSGRP